MSSIATIYYNPKFIDCYTVVTNYRKTEKKRECLSLSRDPTHSTGVSLWGTCLLGDHLGQEIPLCMLPRPIQHHILTRLSENGQDSEAITPNKPNPTIHTSKQLTLVEA